MQMKTQNNYYALIPARSGSKSIKMKNLKTINKRSLLEIAIDNLKSIKSVNEIYVSSDSQKILKKAILASTYKESSIRSFISLTLQVRS